MSVIGSGALRQLQPNVYLNVSFTFDPSQGTAGLQPAISSTTRFQPFLTSPNAYFCSVGRFSVTGSQIPLIAADVDEGQPDPNVTTSVVTLYQPSTGKTGSAPVRWVAENVYEPIPGPPNTPSGQDFGNNSTYYYCSTYQGWAEMVTTAFAEAEADLLANGGTLHVPAAPPQLLYNSQLGISQLLACQENYTDNNATDYPDYIEIWVNGPLDIYFSQYAVAVGNRQGDATKSTRIRVYDQFGTNLTTVGTNNILTMSMESAQGLARWCSLSSIAITTSLPVVQEQIAPAATSTNPNAIASQSILIDFLPDCSVPGSYSSAAMIYNSAGPSYRQYNFLSNSALTQASFAIIWYDSLGRVFPVNLSYGSVCTMKLVFSRVDQFFDTQ